MIRILVFSAQLLCSNFASAEIEILEVVLAREVANREPSLEFVPPGHCSSDNPQISRPVPRVDSSLSATLFVWTRVKADAADTLRHTYFKDGLQIRTQRTRWTWTDRLLNTIEEVNVGLGWKKLANVELSVGRSLSWRTWSTKQIDRVVHAGQWRVDVSLASNPGKVLCEIQFEVI